MAKLTPAQENIIKSMAIDYADGFEWTTQYGTKVSHTIMLRTGLIEGRPVSGGYSWEKEYKLTDAGREYAIAQGWLPAPAASEPTPGTPRTAFAQGDIVEMRLSGERAKIWAIHGDEINIEYLADGQMAVTTPGMLNRIMSNVDAEIERQKSAVAPEAPTSGESDTWHCVHRAHG
jgi:hypothetical protein